VYISRALLDNSSLHSNAQSISRSLDHVMRTLFEICLCQSGIEENVYLDRLYGIEENDIGALIHSSHPGKVFPYVNLSSCVSPITRTVLKVIYKTFRISYMETINDLFTCATSISTWKIITEDFTGGRGDEVVDDDGELRGHGDGQGSFCCPGSTRLRRLQLWCPCGSASNDEAELDDGVDGSELTVQPGRPPPPLVAASAVCVCMYSSTSQ
uniref:Uncharacterized protein n=1 Tax=Oryza glaberrima TaxID=4538 RepID=I1P8Y0_ORYGL